MDITNEIENAIQYTMTRLQHLDNASIDLENETKLIHLLHITGLYSVSKFDEEMSQAKIKRAQLKQERQKLEKIAYHLSHLQAQPAHQSAQWSDRFSQVIQKISEEKDDSLN